MKKHTERQPIDDLFARKLGNTSLPPSADGFDRLQARMRHKEPEVKLVFWRNPDIQRYMAVAACLTVVCLFGWLYWPSGTQTDQAQVAVNQNTATPLRANKTADGLPNETVEEAAPSAVDPVIVDREQFTQVEDKAKRVKTVSQSDSEPFKTNNVAADQHQTVSIDHKEPVLAQTKTVENNVKLDVVAPADITPANPSASDHVAEVDSKTLSTPKPAVERVLVVTIDEPSTLVAARQIAKASVEEKSLVVGNDKPEKEPKTGGLWQQVKRIKEGEVFARRDNAENDERGLLSRAYNGLKHSLDKDKSTK